MSCKLQFIRYLQARLLNFELMILTLGEQGSRIFSENGVNQAPASPCKVVDTVGAGDAFTACFMINYMNGLSISQAQRKASRVAAYVCEHSGATVKIPEEF